MTIPQPSSHELINNRYQIEEVAQGNMGYVLLCHDEKSNKPVAIKTFHDKFLYTKERKTMFSNESLFWLRCDSHPNIVRAIGFLYHDSKPHLVLERVFPNNVRGTTLKDYIFTHAIDYQEMLQIAISICDGMIHVLEKFPQFVHRDLKPENILIGDDLIPKVSDFGMVLEKGYFSDEIDQDNISNDSSNVNHHGNSILGTPAIASPEQCMNEIIDTRSDVYSFGCILYQLATKRLPFYGSSIEEYIKAHTEKKPVSPSDHDNSINFEFSELILQCLAKNPEHRFSDFYQLRDKLIHLYRENFFLMPHTGENKIHFSPDEYLDRAEAFSLLNAFNLSNEELIQAENRNVKPLHLLKTRGIVSFRQHKFHDSKSYFDEIIQLKADAESYLWIARIHLALNDYKESMNVLESSLRYGFDSEDLYIFYAKCLQAIGEIDKALQVLQIGQKFSSRSLRLLKFLASLFHSNRDWKNEYKTLEYAIKRYPYDIDIHLKFAELFLAKREWEKCNDWLEKTVMLPISNPSDWYRIGCLYLEFSQVPQTIEAWENSRQSGNSEPTFIVKLAKLYYRQNNYKKAWNILSKVKVNNESANELKRQVQNKLKYSH